MELLDLPVVFAALAALLLLPGWLLLHVVGAACHLDPTLRPAAALTTSLALLAPALLAVLAVGANLWWCVGWLALCGVVLLGLVHRQVRHAANGFARPTFTTIGGLTLAVALAGGMLAVWTGGDLRRDQTYHTARVLKLVEQDAPTFASGSRIEDGGATTPYAFPLWHGAQAVVVKVTRVDPMLVAWLLPAVLVPLSILAHAALGRVLFGSAGAGLAAAVAWLLARVVDYVPDYRFLTTAQWPGMVAALIVVPLICALVPVALFDPIRRRRIVALALGAIATLVVVGLHANYVLFPALLVSGLLAWSAVWGHGLRVRAAVALCTVWGGAAVAGVLALLPILRDYSRQVGDGSVDAMVRASRNADYFERVGGDWVLRLEPLVGRPLTVVACAIGVALLIVIPRHRAAAFIGAGIAAVFASARIGPLTESVLGLGNLTAVTRLWLALVPPTTIALAGLLLLLARTPAFLRDGGPVRTTLMIGAGAGLGIAAVGWAFIAPGPQVQDARGAVVIATWAVAGTGLLVGAVLRLLRRMPGATETRSVGTGATATRVRSASPRAMLSGGLWILVAMLGAANLLDVRYERAQHRDPLLGDAVDHGATLLDSIDVGAVVLADEQDAYVLPAIAPIHVVGDFKYWLERTDATRTTQRLDAVRSFFARESSDAQRADVLGDWDVDAIVVRPGALAARRWLGSVPKSCAAQSATAGPWTLYVVEDAEQCMRTAVAN